uniref:Matrilin 2 n=1 Tax=Oncorhynchus tshawytscha TaxID=74940 RepID=A0A8C8J2A2_ONCTS
MTGLAMETDTVEEVAAQARQADIQIFAIGVGRVDMNTLRVIGSEPHSEHVYLVANFSQIETLTSVFQSNLCGLDPCSLGNHGCEHDCVNTEDSFMCRCREGYKLRPDNRTCQSKSMACFHGCNFHWGRGTCPPPPAHSEICSDGVMDLVFVIDGSKSLGPANFDLAKQFVNSIVYSLDVSGTGTHMGLLQYSSKVRTEFILGQYTSGRDINRAVSRMQYMGRGSMTGAALRHMFEYSFSAKEGARPDMPRVSIVFTDGGSQDDVSKWATKAKDAGITIYALGVGKAIEEELREIASKPDDKHLYYSRICKEKPSLQDMCKCENVMLFQRQVSEQLRRLTQNNILYSSVVVCIL